MFEAKFSDISTDFTCLALVTELTKFLLYRKQQIPFTFNKMCSAVRKKQRDDENKEQSIRLRLKPSEKLFKLAETCVENIEEIFIKTAAEFSNENTAISEVVLLFGGSLLTPQQVYRLHLPHFELGHLPKHHSGQLVMSEIFQALVESDELHKMFEKPLPPTNMFLLLRLAGHPYSENWLLPKPRYNIPAIGQEVSLNFKFETTDRVACSCKGFQFFSDHSLDNIPISQSDDQPAPSDLTKTNAIWYQVPLVVKGFSDIFVNKVSVSKDWLICQ